MPGENVSYRTQTTEAAGKFPSSVAFATSTYVITEVQLGETAWKPTNISTTRPTELPHPHINTHVRRAQSTHHNVADGRRHAQDRPSHTTHVAGNCGRHESAVVLTKLTVVSGASEYTVATIRTRSNVVTCSAFLTRMIPTLVSYKPTHSQPRCTDLIYIVSGKSAAIFLPLTLPNVDRFSKFFQQRSGLINRFVAKLQ